MENDADKKLPLTAHLEELKKRLIRVLIVMGLGLVVCYTFRDWSFKVITKPLLEVLPDAGSIVFTGLTEAFFVHLKIAFFASLFLTSPYTLFQIWRFISPGLYKKERRYIVPFVTSASLLFIGGILFGYFVALPPAFKFFVSFSTDVLKPMISFREYLGLALKFLLAFGISFELPVFIYFLAKVGIVNATMLRRHRRYAILLIFIAAALLTPSPDALSQIIMAGPLMILYEISIFLAKIADRKKDKPTEPEEEETRGD
ncbi:MAG: twin-arginine translocase subunit TatC [Syntrophobacterales bacterium]|jgi:sec-independent protein translocase protein TatC|nr:twin-arginine translocase subunit TatC [Syntrophobacterales bacterium]